MTKILITGGAGFIGSNLSLKLIEKGYDVIVLDALSPQIHGENPNYTSPLFRSIQNKVRFIQGSILDRTLLEELVQAVSVIVHFAAETGTGQSMYEIERYTKVNIEGTALLLDILTNKPHAVQKMIVASSRSIYGEGKYLSKNNGIVYPTHRSKVDMENGDFEVKYKNESFLQLLPTDEDSKIHPSSVYGITKQVQEQLIMTVCPSIGIEPVAFRYQNVYGPGQSLTNPYTGILSIFSTRIKNNNSINIFEDGQESRDFVFIDDVVTATCLGIESENANGHVFNVGSGVATSVLTVAETLMNEYGIKVPLQITRNFRLGDIRHNYADLSKIEKLLTYRPNVDFVSGIKKFVAWVNEQEVQTDRYLESIEELKQRGLYK